MICLSLNLPAVGVSALEVVAYPHFHCQETAIRPMVEAGRGRFCTSLYQRYDEGWRETEEARIVSPEFLMDNNLLNTLVCGDIGRELGARLMAQNRLLRVDSPASGARRAAFLAEIGWERLLSEKGQRAEELQAMYLSGPIAPAGGTQSAQMARIGRAIPG
jgi:tRNA A37 threonylcarbamoyladenosine modification protein TsaB